MANAAKEERREAREKCRHVGANHKPEEEEIAAVLPRYLNSRAFSIMGGTSEIQTNILAKTLVGL